MLKRLAAALGAALVFASAAGAAPTAGDQKEALYYEVMRLVVAGDYAGVAELADTATASQERFADGTWRVGIVYAIFHSVLSEHVHSQAEWDAVIAKVVAVAETRETAWLMYEQALNARAWQIRGGGKAGDVLPQAWAPFRQYLGDAKTAMDAHKAGLKGNPTWYSIRVNLATETGEPAEVQDAIFEEGRKAFPAYQPLYFNRMRQVAPQWGGHGTTDGVRDLLEKVARSDAALKEGMYARIVWFAEDQGTDILHADWIDKEAMRKSEEAILVSYPDQRNVQKMFWFACELSDKQTAKKIAPAVQEPPIRNLWRTQIDTYRLCREWVEGRTPAFMLRLHERDGSIREVLVH